MNMTSQGITHSGSPGHALQGPILPYCHFLNPKSPKALCGFLSDPLKPWFPPVVVQGLCVDTFCFLLVCPLLNVPVWGHVREARFDRVSDALPSPLIPAALSSMALYSAVLG